jgi:hypothetical protein
MSTLFFILILILWKGRSGRMKDYFGCYSFFDSVEGEKREDERQLWLPFLF